MLDEKIICAGFGGQGVMSMGQLLAYAGMLEDRFVTWMPSYGPEMRGGTAYCCVMISERPVGSPLIAGDASCAVVMNQPSLEKFAGAVVPGGLLLVNSSMTEEECGRDDIRDFYIPANDLAVECGEQRAANMVMLGAYLELAGVVQQVNIIEAFTKVFGKKAGKFISVNTEALNRGRKSVEAASLRGNNGKTDYFQAARAA